MTESVDCCLLLWNLWSWNRHVISVISWNKYFISSIHNTVTFFCCCSATTQPALQLHQERTQVVRSKKTQARENPKTPGILWLCAGFCEKKRFFVDFCFQKNFGSGLKPIRLLRAREAQKHPAWRHSRNGQWHTQAPEQGRTSDMFGVHHLPVVQSGQSKP